MQNKKNQNRLAMSVGVWVFGLGLFIAADGEAQTSSTDMAALDAARDVFQTNCAMCHGYDGVPILPGAPNFAAAERMEKDDEALLKVIASGTETMPPWKDVLNEEQRRAVLSYIRVLPGDPIFTENCKDCHDENMPALGGTMAEKPDDFAGPWEICGGSDVDTTLEPEDIVKVVKLLKSPPKPNLSEAN